MRCYELYCGQEWGALTCPHDLHSKDSRSSRTQRGKVGKQPFPASCSAGNKEWVVTVTGFGLSLEECQVTTQSSNLSLVHLRICTLSVVELGGLKHHMHGAHYLVFSGVEEEK